ncbi:hypothetical protein B0H13DRAFT_1868240 [Mycena leptocephala]|nr:hypothetical protein B0H13DRAFT_1868240 [Mycena leptocephala]
MCISWMVAGKSALLSARTAKKLIHIIARDVKLLAKSGPEAPCFEVHAYLTAEETRNGTLALAMAQRHGQQLLVNIFGKLTRSLIQRLGLKPASIGTENLAVKIFFLIAPKNVGGEFSDEEFWNMGPHFARRWYVVWVQGGLEEGRVDG